MPAAAHATPFSAPARPALTGGRRVGVLVVHGFTGSPKAMRPWAEHLAEQGYAVELPRLPGHGTHWQELNRTRFEDWYAEVRRAFDTLAADCDEVAVCGLSMGGSLALRLAADRPDEVAALVLVNPAIASRRLDIKALPVLKWLVPSFPAIANDISKPGQDEGGYDRTPLKAIHSFIQQWGPLRRDLGAVTAPVLYFRSAEDHVVDDASTPVITSGLGSTDLTVRRLERSFHVATLDHDAEQIFRESAEFLARVCGSDATPVVPGVAGAAGHGGDEVAEAGDRGDAE